MTREEAIRIISGEVLGTTEQTHEAVAMAVEALSTQPETRDPCSDCQEFDCYGCEVKGESDGEA